ncbi:MAG: DUF2095 family protein [Candidatus Thorarchaeota archaeon]
MEENNKKSKYTKKVKIEESNGLKISYNKDELNRKFPHLIEEISLKKKLVQIDSFKMEVEQDYEEKLQKSNKLYPDELYNPSAIDFLRRCTNNEEAINILDYLLKRNELTKQDYNKFKTIISKEGGLKRLIEESGGLKRPGYYLRKYYNKKNNNQKLNSKEN